MGQRKNPQIYTKEQQQRRNATQRIRRLTPEAKVRAAEKMRQWRANPANKHKLEKFREKLRTPEGKIKRSVQAKKYYNSPQGREYKKIQRLKQYGLTPAQKDEILTNQAYGCAICGTTEPKGKGKTFHVDHNHTTGKVRGLLCTQCNIGIGMFRESQERLRLAIVYLSRD